MNDVSKNNFPSRGNRDAFERKLRIHTEDRRNVKLDSAREGTLFVSDDLCDFFAFCLVSEFAHYASTVSASLVDLFFHPQPRFLPHSLALLARLSSLAGGLCRHFLSSPGTSTLTSALTMRSRVTSVLQYVCITESFARSAARSLSVAAYLHLVDDVFAGN